MYIHHQLGQPTSRLEQYWEFLINSSFESQLGQILGSASALWARLQTAVSGTPAYNPRPQTGVSISLRAKMQHWVYFIHFPVLFHLVSHSQNFLRS